MELLEHILTNYGITSFTLTNTVRRRRRDVQDVLNAVQNYGCWCSKPFTGHAYGGEALDDIDRICKMFSRCKKCEKFSSCAGSASDGFTVDYSPTLDTYTCNASSECAMNACHCSADFGITLARYFADNGAILDNNFMSVNSDVCVKSSKNPPNDACCGVSPSWMPYSSTSHQCLAGVISLI